jgi:hypothetical protein
LAERQGLQLTVTSIVKVVDSIDLEEEFVEVSSIRRSALPVLRPNWPLVPTFVVWSIY